MKKAINGAKKILLIVISGCIVISCRESFLDIDSKQFVASEKALLTINDYRVAITGVYAELKSPNYYGRYFPLVPDIMSDDVRPNPWTSRGYDVAEFGLSPTYYLAGNMFQKFYQTIEHANRIILTNINVPATVEDEYNQIKGEAYALRGLAYFDAVRIFGQHYTFTSDASHLGVPLVLEIDDGFVKPSRNTVAQVYEQIIADMTKAISLMTVDPDNSSHLSATAVKALLSKVYLYKEDWDNAERYASEVIADPKYVLVSNANFLDIYNIDNSSESLFEIDFSLSDNNGVSCLAYMYITEGYGDYLPSDSLLKLFFEGDARLQAYSTDDYLPLAYGNKRVNKYPSIYGTDNIKVIRLAEVYLIKAEANYHLGNTTLAQNDVNLIRRRALPTAPNITVTGVTLLNEIRLERRLELCFEGSRFWDIMRYRQNMVRDTINPWSSFFTTKLTYPAERAVFPIPQYEIDNNPNMVQNPGY